MNTENRFKDYQSRSASAYPGSPAPRERRVPNKWLIRSLRCLGLVAPAIAAWHAALLLNNLPAEVLTWLSIFLTTALVLIVALQTAQLSSKVSLWAVGMTVAVTVPLLPVVLKIIWLY